MTPSTRILILSYYKDFEYLKLCLRSIQKFATGFTGTTVVVPKRDRAGADEICRPFGAEVRDYVLREDKPFNHHQVMKCSADLFADGASHVLHTDSDCIFTEPVTPADYFVDGKPVLLIYPFEKLLVDDERHRGAMEHWMRVTTRALGWVATHETMRRHPAVHPVELYPALRQHMARMHGSFEYYVLGQQDHYPPGFTEFNALGNFALKKMPERYHFIDVSVEKPPADKLVQGWSILGQRPELAKEYAEQLATFAKILA